MQIRSIATALALASLLVASSLGTASAQSFSVLHSFGGSDGRNPAARLMQASDGNFYGTTSSGGSATDCPDQAGCGVIFMMTPGGAVSTLHVMTPAEGAQPSRLVQASDGNFYGVASRYGIGPPTGCGFTNSCGTFFRVDPDGTLTVLHNFGTTDPSWPTGGLLLASDGFFYGTTLTSVYRVDTAGNFTTLHLFDRATEGSGLNGPLVEGSDGSFYGTAFEGGPPSSCPDTTDGSCGTIFKIDNAGNVTVLHFFSPSEAFHPAAGLVLGQDGVFRGTTEDGGLHPSFGAGVVFEIDGAGTYSIVHYFDNGGYVPEGLAPRAGLLQTADGAFYGTASLGGLPVTSPDVAGTVFRLDPAGNVTVLRTFTGPDGRVPLAALFQGSDGKLYGSTFVGGANDLGVLFQVDPAAPLPVASLTFDPGVIGEGQTSTGTVTLSSPAPVRGQVVDLSNTNPAAVSLPATVTVPAGATSATFGATGLSVLSPAVVKVFASVAGAGLSTELTVSVGPGPALVSLTLDPTTVSGGESATGTVVLSAPAPPGGALVRLASRNPLAAMTPLFVSVPRGDTSATFTVTTRRVRNTTPVAISASRGGVTLTATLTVTP
ncbi:MAG: hypothetical protein A3F92_00145 [Candidatus Rokubacteria bacterium RIFCSPLOWO2_12_FULL_71_22]|nr:MAG: hypothetical protein A3F92_00145 [Candidatus Rokubacteria bacterium RIFCSPLOWO2_12_FULL_71_22]